MVSKIGQAEAISRMRSVDEALDARWQDLSREWSPDALPATLAFAEFARATCALPDQAGGRVQKVLDLVESLLVDGDSEVKEIVRTGFIEALVNIPGATEGVLWIDRLGPESRRYADEWNAFWAGGNVSS
jgi:hypothetical protein